MSFSSTIAQHIPYLRRFGRALTGSQSSGDSYALATLEAMTGDERFGGTGTVTRISLYRTFLKIWGSVDVNSHVSDPAATGEILAADRSLDALTPAPRVAFLLRAVEGFTTAEMCDVMGRSSDDIEALLAAAGREIAAQLRTDVLIIEDEPIIALDIESMVMDLGHSVIEIARTHREAVEAIRERKPGLILADIQLADGSSGVDAVNEILLSYDVPVIFITAYPERLLTGERPEPTFLITKPFRVDTVKAIMSQALFFDKRAAIGIRKV